MYIIYLQFNDGAQGYYIKDDEKQIFTLPNSYAVKDKKGKLRIEAFPSEQSARAKAERLKHHFTSIEYSEVLLLKE